MENSWLYIIEDAPPCVWCGRGNTEMAIEGVAWHRACRIAYLAEMHAEDWMKIAKGGKSEEELAEVIESYFP